MEEDLQHLKKKVTDGAQIIITQICFCAKTIVSFIEKCRLNHIHVPIIPGLYIPKSFAELKRILDFTKVDITKKVFEQFKSLENNQDEFEKYSVNYITKMMREIQDNSAERILCYHFFTMNDFTMLKKIINDNDFSEYQE